METRIQTLEHRIAKITTQLAQLGDLRIGSLSEQYNVCGRAGCRCKASPPIKHGPYHQLSFTHGGKGHTLYVRPHDVEEVSLAVANYRKFRELTNCWIELEIAFAKCRREETSGSSHKL